MSAAMPALDKLTLRGLSANRARLSVRLDQFGEKRISAQVCKIILWPTPPSCEVPEEHIVILKPRKFGEAGRHFLKVSRPVDWPTDEPDID